MCLVVSTLHQPSLAVGIAACNTPSCTYLPFLSRYEPLVLVEKSETTPNKTNPFVVRVAGSIVNNGNIPAHDVVVEVRYYDSATNALLYSQTQATILPATLPGQYNPFQVYTETVRGVSFRSEVRVVRWNPSSIRMYRNVEVTLTEVRYAESMPGAYITGTVRNNNAMSLYAVKLLIWCIDQQPSIEPQQVISKMSPGQSQSFNEFVRCWNRGTPPYYPIRAVAQGSTTP